MLRSVPVEVEERKVEVVETAIVENNKKVLVSKVKGIPVCTKSSMPGYVEGKALEAAIEGFNKRGDDIDECNTKIQEWAKKLKKQEL